MTDFSSHSLGRRMKGRAPPPPQQAPQPTPRRMPRSNTPEDGGTSGVDTKENILRQTVDLQLTLPGGGRASHTADGRKALMDLLVELCSRFHLNPALHTLELYSPEGHCVGFKPNLLLGSLDVASVLIKEKVLEEKVARRPAPKVPEKTVRLMVNYHGNQKAVVRVNPLSPLQDLIPVIADKCDFNPAHVLLLRDSVSHRELPLDRSLTQLGVKEVYVLDQSLALLPKMASAPVLNYPDSTYSSSASLSRAEKKSFLGLFQTRRAEASNTVETMDTDRYTDTHSNGTYSVTGVSPSSPSPHKMSPKSDLKKRRAPAPPATAAPTVEESHTRSHQVGYVSETMQRKRKAPAPPTPASITRGLDNSPAAPDPTPSKSLHAKMAATSTKVKTKTKRSVSTDIPNSSSPTPSSSTVDSLAVQDSSSEFSHSLDDSDLDPDQTGSQLSSLTSSTASGSVRMVVSNVTEEKGPAEASGGLPESEHDSALNLKLEDVESNRHSTMDFVHTFKRSTEDAQTVDQEDETASVSSSGGSSSLIDHGYAASDGIGEDSGLVCSPYDTQPTSPEGSVSVHGNTGLQKPMHDTSSDSDEGCATWESRNRHGDLKPHSKSRGLTEHDEKTLDITWRFHHFETPPADNMAPVEQTRVPVSVVDMDVPVTAIDEVLEEFEVKQEATVTPRVGLFDHKGVKADAELRNKNNNAWTEADSRKASDWVREEKKKTKDKTLKETNDTRLKVEKQNPPEKVQPMYQFNSLPKHSKITNVTSRFGMKTFTVVPPKPTVIQTSQDQVATGSSGAIKIDEQGNMVRTGTPWNKTSSSSSEFKKSDRSPQVGRAKESWSSSERQESVGPVRKDKFEISRRADAAVSEWRTLRNEDTTGTVEKVKKEKVELKITAPKVIQQPSPKQNLPPPVQTNSQNRDLSFLKPSRRTSSHYVASAITKHRANPAPSTLEAPVPSRASQSEQQNLEVSRHRSTDSVDARQLHREEKTVERRPSPLRVPSQHSNLDVRKHQSRSPSPSAHRPPESKPLPAPKPASSIAAASAKKTSNPERLVIPLGGDEECPAPPASIFGPVKKFKPVVVKPVEKESSLHSDLMEAIQNSGGKDRLKKVSSPGPNGAKKLSYVEEENERSALLAAIRAQNNPGRLKKTQSAAAHELTVIRESVSEEQRRPKAAPSSTTITAPPPPPAPPAPGPPPPLLLKPSAVSRPSPSDPTDAATAREAMLEAIRSGSAAERLRKVSAPAKTIKVNGRRGTMQAAASSLSRM
ncbi:protein cordon-bleu isoform 1-T1 [Synchiropus picturatus]